MLQKPRRSLLLLLLSMVALFLGPPVLSELEVSANDTMASDSKSAIAYAMLDQAEGLSNDPAALVLVRLPHKAPEARTKRVRAVISVIRGALPSATVISYLGSESKGGYFRLPVGSKLTEWQRRFFSRDTGWTAVLAYLEDGQTASERIKSVGQLRQSLDRFEGVLLGGRNASFQDLSQRVHHDLRKGEMLALPILLIVLLWCFQRLFLAALPLIVGVVTLAQTLLLVRVLHWLGLDFSLLAMAPVAGLALGLSVDYSLLLVSRYRDELRKGRSPDTALQAAVAGTGPTVMTSACAILFAVLPLSLVQIPLLSSLGRAAAACAVIGALNAMTIVPVALALYGKRIGESRRAEGMLLRAKRRGPGFWTRVPAFACKRPKLVIVVTSAALLLLAAPVLSMRIGAVGVDAMLGQSESTEAAEVAQNQFPRELGYEHYGVFVSAPAGKRKDLLAIRRQVEAIPDVASVGKPSRFNRSFWEFDVESRSPIGSPASQETARRIQGLQVGYDVYVASPAAVAVDRERELTRMLPFVLLATMLALSIVIFLLTRSLFVPAKMLALTVGTTVVTLGVLVLIFQWPASDSEFSTFDAAQLITMVVMIVALVTDYGIFVVARIFESHRRGLTDRDAIRQGLEQTGPVVSAAAVVFCVAMGAFALSDITLISQLCLGMMIAVMIDATVIRALLVPAVMTIMGRWNWWAPAWLLRPQRADARAGN